MDSTPLGFNFPEASINNQITLMEEEFDWKQFDDSPISRENYFYLSPHSGIRLDGVYI